MTRPQRHKKGDRLTYPGATPEEVRCDFALAPFDRMARELEQRWGIDVLPGLVSPELAERYGRAIAHLNACIDAADPLATAAAAANCCKGLLAMEAAALEAGHEPAEAEAWEITVNGRTCVLARDMAHWQAIAATRPGVTIYSLREVAMALESFGSMVADAKAAFPSAEVTAVRKRTPLEDALNDQIPF